MRAVSIGSRHQIVEGKTGDWKRGYSGIRTGPAEKIILAKRQGVAGEGAGIQSTYEDHRRRTIRREISCGRGGGAIADYSWGSQRQGIEDCES